MDSKLNIKHSILSMAPTINLIFNLFAKIRNLTSHHSPDTFKTKER